MRRTIEEMDTELRTLRARLAKLENGPAQRERETVEEIISDGRGSASKFSRAVAEAEKETDSRLALEAEMDLQTGTILKPADIASWRARFRRVGDEKLDDLLARNLQ